MPTCKDQYPSPTYIVFRCSSAATITPSYTGRVSGADAGAVWRVLQQNAASTAGDAAINRRSMLQVPRLIHSQYAKHGLHHGARVEHPIHDLLAYITLFRILENAAAQQNRIISASNTHP